MDKSCGQFQQTRAEGGKLKSNLEWPNQLSVVFHRLKLHKLAEIDSELSGFRGCVHLQQLP